MMWCDGFRLLLQRLWFGAIHISLRVFFRVRNERSRRYKKDAKLQMLAGRFGTHSV